MTNAEFPTIRQGPGGESRRSVLPGGLRIVTEEVPGAHSFAVGFFVGTGSRHESAGLHGVSHFLEHVLFKGTPRRSAEEISRAIEELGGDLNAYTGKEHTCFHARVLPEHAEIAVDVLGDMLSSSRIRAEDVDAEREVILDEIALQHDDPAEVANELVSERLFRGTPLERSTIGARSSIKSLSRDQVTGFWRRHYRADELVVAACGAVDHERLVTLLGGFDAELAAPERRRAQRMATTDHRDPAVITRSRPLEHSQVVLGFASPGVFAAPGELDALRPALNILVTVLGGGMSSRLFMEVRERRGLAYSIDAAEGAYTDAGMVTVEWGSAPERVPEITELVRAEIADVLERGVSEAELGRAKTQLRGQVLLGYEGPESRMGWLGGSELMGDRRTIAEILERYDAVTADDVLIAARTVLAGPPVLAVVGAKVERSKLTPIIEGWPATARRSA